MATTPHPFRAFSRTPRPPWISRATLLGALLAWGCVAPAHAQVSGPVFVDDSPRASDGLFRARELAGVGNLDEAVRVLQPLLDEEGGRVLATAGDPDLFTSVRDRVHELLLQDARLLERYRALEAASAQRLLDEGHAARVERAYLLTGAGYEAALRIAQGQFEAAQFHAARRTLEQLEKHPDRGADGARSAANLLASVAQYIDPEVAPLAMQRAREWGWVGAPGDERAAAPVIEPARDVFTGGDASDLHDLLPRPLWSDALGDGLPLEPNNANRGPHAPVREGALWLFSTPVSVGDTVYAQDTQTITAWNRFTLSMRWRVKLEGVKGRRYVVGAQQGFEELASVAADGAYVAAVMGLALHQQETPSRTLLCIDGATGEMLWNHTIDDFKMPEMEEGTFRGPAVMDEGTIVVAVDKNIARRRLQSTYALGVDARTGDLRWARQLGSTGSMAYNVQAAVGDAPVAARGDVYFTDRIGFAAALEAATGRVRWIRRIVSAGPVIGRAEQPWQCQAPVIAGESLIILSPDRQKILMLSRASGTIVAECGASKFSNPDYLLAAGGKLLGVSSTAIVATDLSALAGEFSTTRIARFESGQARGRAVVFGTGVMIPVMDGVQVFDVSAANEAPVLRLALDKPGNVLPLDGQLIVVDDKSVHTYLVWEVAERMLRGRMQAEPGDPGPAITFAELSYRAGRPQNIVAAVDSALGAIERDPLSPTSGESQHRLFGALFAMVEPSAEEATRTPLTLEVRSALLERLDRSASTPPERVAFLLASGRFAEAIEQPSRAVAAYQAVLDSPELASSTFAQEDTAVSSDFEATRRLRRVVQMHGPGLYEAYQADADRRLQELAESLDPEPFEAVARRYPVSRAAAAAWLRAAERYTTQGRGKLAAQALEEGLASASGALAPSDPLIGELTGRLVGHLARSGLVYPALAALDEFQRARPGMVLTERGAAVDQRVLLDSIRADIAERDRRPRIGEQPSATAVMVGWAVLSPVAGRSITPVTDRLLMESSEQELALFRAEGAGALTKVWGGVRDEEFLWMDQSGVYLSRQVGVSERADYTVLRRGLDTGEVAWETPAFRTLFKPGAVDALLADKDKTVIPVMDAPLEARVPVTDVLFVNDRQTLVMCDRTGRTAAFDLADGKSLWQRDDLMPRLHGLDLDAGTLLMGGAEGPIDLDQPMGDVRSADPMTGVVIAMDARTGQTLHRYETASRIRWVQLMPEGHSVVGQDDGVVSLDAYRGRVRWRSSGAQLRESLVGWALPGRVIVRAASEDHVHQLGSDDGSVRDAALDVRDRLGSGFGAIEIKPMGDNTSLATRLGLAVYDPRGALIGLDAQDTDATIHFAAFGEGRALTLTSNPERPEDGMASYLVNVFDARSLKIVSRTAITLGMAADAGGAAMLDGKLLVTNGSVTQVIDIPAE